MKAFTLKLTAFVQKTFILFGNYSITPLILITILSMEYYMTDTSPQKAGFVALVGAPNAGKSTLLNALVGSKVSIVSHKAQTTRTMIRGIAIEDQTQIIFVDTPGIFAPKRRLDKAMVASAWGGALDAEIICFIVDARRGLTDENKVILDKLKDIRQPKMLILNKIDLIERQKLLEVATSFNKIIQFQETFMISALKDDGVDLLKKKLAGLMPIGPWLYPEDQISDAPMRFLSAEITREKLYERLHEELPYQSTVETEQWENLKDGSIRIKQTIYVARESQRKIVLGKDGKTIKAIGQSARKELSHIVETTVHLFLFVKVRENWINDPERYRYMGLDFPKE